MFENLQVFENRYEELTLKLYDPQTAGDREAFAALMKEHKELEPIVEAYRAWRQCQQDLVTINRLEAELKDAKYKALSSSSTLTERCRESHILEILKNNADSLLHPAEQPPYIITVPDEEE